MKFLFSDHLGWTRRSQAKESALHALNNSTGNICFIFEKKRLLRCILAESILRQFARECALDVIHLWNPSEIVLQYLRTGDENIRAAAWAAAWAAVKDPAWAAAWAAARAAACAAAKDPAKDAAWAAAKDAAWAAAWAAAKDATWAAAWAAAKDAAWAAAKDAAWAAAKDAARAKLESMLLADQGGKM